LASLVSLVIDADMLVMMTDVDGFYDSNPLKSSEAKRFSVISKIDDAMLNMAGGTESSVGTGGMFSKLNAARVAMRGGVTSAVIRGDDDVSLEQLFSGEDIGTVFLCGEDRQTRRQQWISEVLTPAGRLLVDEGAERAILHGGCSLLPVGMTGVEGSFDKGECVELIAGSGLIARGLTNYHSDDLRQLVGVHSDAIEGILGYADFNSVIHRDNLVLME